MGADTITSIHNPRIKSLCALYASSSERREKGLFPVEGKREVSRCIESGYSPSSFFICPEIYGSVSALPPSEGADIFYVSGKVYERIAYRAGTEGVICVFRTPGQLGLDRIETGGNPIILVLESIEKPGNIGAVLRTADAAGADAVIICDPVTDLFNPNIIRASLGTVFSVPVALCSSTDAVKWLKSRRISILTAQLQDSSPYYDTDMHGPVAIVFGSEANGLSPLWRENSDARIMIPMAGIADSLNISVSAAVLCYEAVRQRHASTCKPLD